MATIPRLQHNLEIIFSSTGISVGFMTIFERDREANLLDKDESKEAKRRHHGGGRVKKEQQDQRR